MSCLIGLWGEKEIWVISGVRFGVAEEETASDMASEEEEADKSLKDFKSCNWLLLLVAIEKAGKLWLKPIRFIGKEERSPIWSWW